MEPTCIVHPEVVVLAAFGLGKLDPGSADAVSQHLEECEACRRMVENVPADTLLTLLRAGKPTGPGQLAANALGTGVPGRVAGKVETRSDVQDASSFTVTPAGTGSFLAATDIPAGLVNHPRYRIVRLLGRGGMGAVFLAEHTVMGQMRAIKVVKTSLVDSPKALERFHREVKTAAMLDHPNIVRAFDAEQSGSTHFLVMDFVEGIDLAEVLRRKGRLPIAHTCHYIRQAALGLQYAHEQNMVHRDLKPQNLILTAKGVVKILDFGLAKIRSDVDLSGPTPESVVLGTPDYMPPEQWQDARSAGIQADIYSLGCTLYALLTGAPPFEAAPGLPQKMMAHLHEKPEPVQVLRPEVPAELAALVNRMLAKKPADRPQTPREVAQALQPFIKSIGKAAAQSPLPARAVDKVSPARTSHAASPTAAEAKAAAPSGTPSAPQPDGITAPRFQRNRLIVGATAGMLFIAILALWAGGVFKLKTPHGSIVIEGLPTDAEVTVDGEQVAVKWGDGGKSAQVGVKPGTRRIVAKVHGAEVIGEEVVVGDGDRKTFRARLEPAVKAATPVDSPPAPASNNGKSGAGSANTTDSKRLDALVVAGSVWKGAYSVVGSDEQGTFQFYVTERADRVCKGIFVKRVRNAIPPFVMRPFQGILSGNVFRFGPTFRADGFSLTATLQGNSLDVLFAGPSGKIAKAMMTKEPTRPESAQAVFTAFDKDDTEGWYTLNQDGTANATQSVRIDGPVYGNYWICARPLPIAKEFGWHAPAKYHGNHAEKLGRFLIYGVYAGKVGGHPRTDWYVRLRGARTTLYLDGTALEAPSAKQWKHYSIRLDSAAGWKKLGGGAATDQEIKAVLADVTDLRIKGEFGAKADCCLDSVVFGADEPVGPGGD